MTCRHAYLPQDGREAAFGIDASRIVFGRGVLREAGDHARALGCKRAALFTDQSVLAAGYPEIVRAALGAAGIDCFLYDQVRVEPTDESFQAAAAFARDGEFDAYVSVGGGSVIDTCKAAALYATYPTSAFLDYVNQPVGLGRAIPGPLPTHIACPTTCGTGSETTGIAVCDVLALQAKTGIASPRLKPTLALVDPLCTRTLPAQVVAASGFDVLCHALESFTARPYVERNVPNPANTRPMSQGANPWSDLGSQEALRLTGKYLVRAVSDSSDFEAREKLSWAATLAGVAFGNAGVHLPHAMAYAVAGLVSEFKMPGYPQDEPMVPHGVSVVINAPSTFRFTAPSCPERHREALALLGGEVRGVELNDSGEALARELQRLMQATAIPNGLSALGYTQTDAPALTKGTLAQQRLLQNSPRPAGAPELEAMFNSAMRYW